jgi:Zn-dependent protease with chaperone function
LRFVLLIVTVLGASLFIYNWICLQMHLQELLVTASCALRQTRNSVLAISALNVPALQISTDAVRQCAIPYHRVETTYMIGGVVLVGAVAVVIYWLFPFWNLWRGKLVPLSTEDSPELMTYLAELYREAQLARPPSFVCNPFNQTITGLAFGRVGRYYVALSGGLVTLFSTDRAGFRAIVLHELAHLRNADVSKTYFAIATWWAFVMVALIPFAVISAVGFAKNPDDFLVAALARGLFQLRFKCFLPKCILTNPGSQGSIAGDELSIGLFHSYEYPLKQSGKPTRRLFLITGEQESPLRNSLLNRWNHC